MPSRRNRRLLFEVAGRAGSRPAVRPPAPRPRPSPPPAGTTAADPQASVRAEPPAIARWQRPELWAAIAGLVVVAVVAFYAGRRYERYTATTRNRGTPPGGSVSPRPVADEKLEPRAAMPAGSSTPAPKPPPASEDGSPAQVPPRVELKPGYSYIVVQHFPRSRRRSAEDAVRFLLDHGVSAALLAGRDLQVIVPEPYDIDNRDPTIARRERQRAEAMQARIRELGRRFNKTHGYAFKDCYLRRIR